MVVEPATNHGDSSAATEDVRGLAGNVFIYISHTPCPN